MHEKNITVKLNQTLAITLAEFIIYSFKKENSLDVAKELAKFTDRIIQQKLDENPAFLKQNF